MKEKLKGCGQAAVAFSGGKDSFFLLKMALEALGREKVAAFFVKTPFSSIQDSKRVEYFAGITAFNLKRISLDFDPLEEMLSNPRDRCYFCKTKIFRILKKEAASWGGESVLDGTTASELAEYRPGLKALEELGIRSPLKEVNIDSDEVRSYLENMGVAAYYLTSSTCLATRFPYGLSLSDDLLRRFDRIESFLVESGVYPVKVRYIPEGIRIETAEMNFYRVIELKDQLEALRGENRLKFITLDLGGIKTGVWD